MEVNNRNENALVPAIHKLSSDLLVSFVRQCIFDRLLNYGGATSLHYCAINSNPSTTKWLLDLGLNVDAQTSDGETPLMLAVRCNCEESVKILLKANANIFLTDRLGKTALQKFNNNYDMPGSLIPGMIMMKLMDKCESEEEAAIKLYRAKCPLYLAVLLRNSKITKFLLERGVDVNIHDDCNKMTALHMAVYIQDPENVDVLLANGADIEAEDNFNETPIAHISSLNYKAGDRLGVLQILLHNGAKLTTWNNAGVPQIRKIFKEGCEEAIRMVLQTNRMHLNTKDVRGYTLLHYMTSNCNVDIPSVINNRDVDVNASSNDGCTALHIAAIYGGKNTIQFLLDLGADINVQNSGGYTPLLAVVVSNRLYSQHLVDCVDFLIQLGADPQILTRGNLTIIDLAENAKKYDLIQPILAQLAILEALGTSVKVEISTKINSNPRYRESFSLYKKQIGSFHKLIIWRSVTLFQLMTENEEKLLVYFRNQQLIMKLLRLQYRNNQNTYYFRKLRERITSCLQKVQLKVRSAVALYNIMQVSHDSQPTIIDKICSSLNNKDLLALSVISNVQGE